MDRETPCSSVVFHCPSAAVIAHVNAPCVTPAKVPHCAGSSLREAAITRSRRPCAVSDRVIAALRSRVRRVAAAARPTCAWQQSSSIVRLSAAWPLPTLRITSATWTTLSNESSVSDGQSATP
ncbi:hypothetical protein BE08_22315 [Sorangium cellulosum]|uniref:Uncharacterized protein n=1 Tax=Sorangium cellulosum TaxID=56 RepID=A0A150P5R5_SORCE|nr:hypothetical protein BE08_22315 [Sorangium cellulosum]